MLLPRIKQIKNEPKLFINVAGGVPGKYYFIVSRISNEINVTRPLFDLFTDAYLTKKLS